MNILSIDPGTTESAFVIMGDDCKPERFGKISNEELLSNIYKEMNIGLCVIEKIECYGAKVGYEVFDTCVWAGRFHEAAINVNIPVEYVTRRDEKMTLCGTMRANDKAIRAALIEIFAEHDFVNGKGKADNKDWFYGFKADIWAAFAVGYTYRQMEKEGRA